MSTAMLFALAGVIGPIAFMTIMTFAGLIRPGYDPIARAGSDLAVGENGWLQTINFLTFGALVVLFSVGLRRALTGGRAVRAGCALVTLAGVGLILAGVFPTDLQSEPMSAHGLLHWLASLLVFIPL